MSTQSIGVSGNKLCALCTRRIHESDRTNLHHTPTLRSKGGQTVVEVHESCHRNHHTSNGDFAHFGRIGGQISALSKLWSFNLKNVRTDPAHEINRDFYQMFYRKN